MRFARVHKFAAYTLAILGLLALCTGGELGGVITVVIAIAVIASWFAEGDLLQSSRYARVWSVVLVGGLVLEVARALFFRLPYLTAAVEFAALLQISRLANRRTARDYQQITVLAMLHLIAATVLGGGLSYAACFFGFVVATPWAMTLGHLRREIEGNYLADARAGRAGVPIDVARILRSRRVVGPGLLIGSSLLAIPVFAITAVVFVLFPRIGLGIFSIRPPHANAVTGFGDRVDLRGHGTIRDDPTIVLRVEPPDLGSNPPAFRSFRLRGASFDHYDGHEWTRTLRDREHVNREGAIYEIHGYPDAFAVRPFRIVLDPLDPPVVLLPENTVALRVEPRIEAGQPRYPDLTTDVVGEVQYGTTDDLGLVYSALVATNPQPAELPDLMRQLDLELPRDLSPRVAALAAEITAPYTDRLSKALAVQTYLRRFRYTLDLESGQAAHPLEDFLFRTRAGHCEYFSSAMAIMLRTQGIPTRNVTGFLGGVYNRWGNFYAIRESDAHSWVEVYDERQGWVTFDPTPLARETPVAASGVFAELDAMIEALRLRWRRYVVSFDLGTQAQIAMRFVRLFEGRRHRGYEQTEPRESWADSIRVSVRGAYHSRAVRTGTFATLALAAAGIVWMRRRRRTTGPAPKLRPSAREAIALVHELDAALEVRGYRRPKTRSPVGFADDLLRRGAPIAPLAVRVAARYAAARFGDEPLGARELDALRRELRQAPHLGA